MTRHKSGFIRISISISRDLKRAMEGVTADVNWSAVAAQAFQQKVAEVINLKKEKNMDDVVQRLRTSKRRGEGESFEAGRRAGLDWARDSAEYLELQRFEDCESEIDNVLKLDTVHFNDLAWIVSPENNGFDGIFSEWVGDDHPEHANDRQFLRGFRDGAIEVWQAVKQKI